jgi:hypothetical protein
VLPYGPPPLELPTSSKWDTVTLTGANNSLAYAKVAQDGSRNIADVTDTFGPLDIFKAHRREDDHVRRANDELIYPRGVINYYRQMAVHYRARRDQTGFDGVQRFYRLFRAPGVGHCGGSGYGAWPQNGADFQAVVAWVENGIAPSQVIGATAAALTPVLTRPLCPYPQTAHYSGSGSIYDAANWSCGGNIDTPAVICPDARVQFKEEVNGPIDYAQTGAEICIGTIDAEDSGS